MSKKVTALDTISGQVGEVPEIYLTTPGFEDHLVEVEPGTKSYDPEKYKPKTADEWREDRKDKPKAQKSAEVGTTNSDKPTPKTEI